MQTAAVDFEADAMGPSADTLGRLAELAQKQMALEDAILEKNNQLKELTARLVQVSEVDIPGLLDESGLSDVRLKDGTRVQIKEDLRVSAAVGGKYYDAIMGWLKRTGHDDLIKNDLTVSFAKGEESLAKRFIASLRRRKKPPYWTQKQTVNTATLAKLLRELLEDGDDVPLDELGAFIQKRAKLERSR